MQQKIHEIVGNEKRENDLLRRGVKRIGKRTLEFGDVREFGVKGGLQNFLKRVYNSRSWALIQSPSVTLSNP